MKVRLSMSANFVSDNQKVKLEKYGFKFKEIPYETRNVGFENQWMKDDNIDEINIEINTLEDIINLFNDTESDIILKSSKVVQSDKEEYAIEIYNGYRE